MSRLEEKFKELGYTYNEEYINYKRKINEHISICIDFSNRKITDYYILDIKVIRTKEHIDNLQQAFNQMQKDLEELKEYEKLV